MKQITWEKDSWKWSYEFYENGYNWKGVISWDSMFNYDALVEYNDSEYRISRHGFWKNHIQIKDLKGNLLFNVKYRLFSRSTKFILSSGEIFVLKFRYKKFKLIGKWVFNKKDLIVFTPTSSYKSNGVASSNTNDEKLDAFLIPLAIYIRRSFYNK